MILTEFNRHRQFNRHIGHAFKFVLFLPQIAGYIQELLTQSGSHSQLKMGLVQTAYANGSSTKYASETLVSQVHVCLGLLD